MAMKSEPFGRVVCDALGLPAALIRSVTVSAVANQPLHVVIELLPELTDDAKQRIMAVLAVSNERVIVDCHCAVMETVWPPPAVISTEVSQ